MNPVSVEFARVSYSPAGEPQKLLLRNISLTIDAGTTTALLGRSGSGKTTLLRSVNGLVTPTSGEVRIQGKVVGQKLDTLRSNIGYVIQETGLFPHMTIARNAGIALELQGWAPERVWTRVQEVLELVGIDPASVRDRYPWQLSGGQRQRVGIARALAADPPLLLMDEPFGALDPITRVELQEMLRSLLGRLRKTVLVVTHDLDEALYLADRVVFLSAGEVIANLLSSEVPSSEEPQVKDYLKAVYRRRET